MARYGARGLEPGLGLNCDNCVAGRAGPDHTFCGPGPDLIIHFAGGDRAGFAQLLRARAWPGPEIIRGDFITDTFCCIAYYDELIAKLASSGYGCRISQHFVGALSYADDITLLSPSRQGLQ